MGNGLKTLAGEENCVLLFKVQSSLPIPPFLGLYAIIIFDRIWDESSIIRVCFVQVTESSGIGRCFNHQKQRNWALFCSPTKAAELGVVLTTLLVFRPRSEELSPRLNKKATYNETNYNDLTDQILSEWDRWSVPMSVRIVVHMFTVCLWYVLTVLVVNCSPSSTKLHKLHYISDSSKRN